MYTSNIRVDWADAPVGRATVVNKKIWNDATQQFESRVFIRIHCTSAELRTQKEWMTTQFGEARYQGSWWYQELTNDLWMADSLATFWYLKNGK
jgi:hypothetical protein